jgi:hypothetical protein
MLLIILFAFSCKKNIKTEVQSPSVSKERKPITATMPNSMVKGVSLAAEGYLHFDSKEDYERIIESLTNASDDQLNQVEAALGFTSGYTYFGIKEAEEKGTEVRDPLFKNSVYFDEMILRLTDKNGIFQVGDYIFKLELDNGYILQMYEQDKEAYFGNFINGEYVSQVMNKWNPTMETEDNDIWEMLGTGVTGQEPMGLIGSIRDLWGDRVKYVEEGSNASVDQGWRYKVIGSYQNLWLYRSVIIKFKYEKQGNALPQRTVMNILCENSSTPTWGRLYYDGWQPHWKAPILADHPYDSDRRYTTKWRMYEGGRKPKIQGADISLNVSYEDRNDGFIKTMFYYWEMPI